MDVNELQSLYRKRDEHCYVVNITVTHGVSQSENPFAQALPILCMQIAVIMLITHGIYYLLKPLHIPRIAAYILGGILVGPSALFNFEFFSMTFTFQSITLVETVSFWVLTCHLFLVGLEMDVESILRTTKKAVHIALAFVLVPFLIGIALFLLINHDMNKSKAHIFVGSLYWAGALSVTGFPVVGHVLGTLRLLHTELGRMAVSVSVINDMISWVLLAFLLTIRVSLESAIFAFVSTIGFTVFCILLVRPALYFIIKRTSKEDNYSDYYLCFIIVSISIFACLSEILGTTSLVGGFVFGLILPDRKLASILLEKFEDFISGYLLPIFFALCGFRIKIWEIKHRVSAFIVISLACVAKIVASYLASYVYKMQSRDCFALGVLMNAKGILAPIILFTGVDAGFISEQDHAIMVIAVLLMTAFGAPIIASMYRPAKRLSHYKRRMVQKVKETEFRILTCFYDMRTVLGMVHLLDCANPTKESPLSIFALQLLELTGRASAMLVVHNSNKKRSSNKDPQTEKIITTLETYANLNEYVNLQSMTALSPFSSMHEDICSLAEEKHVALLIIPYHKLPSEDGKLEEEGKIAYRGVNLDVLLNAPCTVGIFVDRGFGSIHEESNLRRRQIAMLFVGGPDDREALELAYRMARGHGISLTVVRFIAGDGMEEMEPPENPGSEESQKRLLTSPSFVEKQRRMDEDYVNEFRLKTNEEEFISYQERVVNNDEETVETLKEMHHIFDLYIVGKGEGIVSPVTAGLSDWCEFPELGPIGDLLVTSSFARGSVLVVQQYAGPEGGVGDSDDTEAIPDAPGSATARSQQFGDWHSPLREVAGNDREVEVFAKV